MIALLKAEIAKCFAHGKQMILVTHDAFIKSILTLADKVLGEAVRQGQPAEVAHNAYGPNLLDAVSLFHRIGEPEAGAAPF